MDIKLILFDLDDTLWPCHRTILTAEETLYQWLLQRFPSEFSKETQLSLRQQRLEVAVQYPEIAHDFTKIRYQSLYSLCIKYQVDVALAQQATIFFRQQRNKVFPYQDVEPVLLQLQKQYVLASLTNGNAQVEETSLGQYFQYKITAADIGCSKPDPAIFLAACTQSQVGPDQCLMVGDDMVRDIQPAKQLGMTTVWINRNEENNIESVADWQCKDLYCLQDLLGNMEES